MLPAATLLASSTVQPSASPCRSRVAAPMVMLMLVPVSPSGTGKTFSSSIWLRWLAMLLAPLIMLSLKTEPLIILRILP